MLTPVGWHHYLVLLAIPFVQMVASAAQGRSDSRAVWMAALAYLLSAISLRAFSRFMVRPPTEFQLTFPWLAGVLEETSFIALLTGYIAAYWFATDRTFCSPLLKGRPEGLGERSPAPSRGRAFSAASPR